MNLSDIISKSINHNRLAQKELVQHFAPYLLGVCRRYLTAPEDAKDALQDAFVLIFTNLEQFHSPESQFKFWARRITINAAISKTRRAYYNNEKATSNLPENSYIPTQSLEAEDIIKHISQLSELQKIVFNLFAIDGYSHKEIAQTLDIPLHLSKNTLFRARKILQEQIIQAEKKIV